MTYLYAFLIGGGICVIGQILMDATKLTAPRVLVILVTAGALLQAFHLYEPLVNLAQTGARAIAWIWIFSGKRCDGRCEGKSSGGRYRRDQGRCRRNHCSDRMGVFDRTCFQSQVGSMRGFVRRAAREMRGCRTVGDKGQLRGSEGQPVYAGLPGR